MLLSATSLFKPSGDATEQKFAGALVNGITHDLRISLIVIAVLGIGGAVGSKIYSSKIAPKSASAKRA